MIDAGLCGRCRHARRVENRRGSVFLLCDLSRVDPAFPRYPRLPVIRCAWFREAEPGAEEAGSDGE